MNAQALQAPILFRMFLHTSSETSYFVNCKGAFCLFLGYRVTLSSLHGKAFRLSNWTISPGFAAFFGTSFGAQYSKEIKWVFFEMANLAISKGCCPIPASINYFLVFLVLQIYICNSRSPFDAIMAGVAWAHRKMGFPSPADHILVKLLISTEHRMLGRVAINRRLPLLQSHLMLLIEKYKFATLDFLQIHTLITWASWVSLDGVI